MCDHEECGELTMNHAQATNNTTSSIISVPSNHELVPPPCHCSTHFFYSASTEFYLSMLCFYGGSDYLTENAE